jgi:2-polyprenyl-3-methyl-5-hydroxy-6-metoxy-1,4-benzoquinol methylase
MEINKSENNFTDTKLSNLGQSYWDKQYESNSTGWDLGEVSPPIKAYIDQLTNKNLSILIPGCGNTHEADYLLQQNFTNVTVIDIAPTLVEKLKIKYASNPNIHIILGDFFAHQGQYDLIIEQTFFCALNPSLRESYVKKMNELLAPKGKLMGVLFDRTFEIDGPPFGGNQEEYKKLFQANFDFIHFITCYNSYHKRANTELFVLLRKK